MVEDFWKLDQTKMNKDEIIKSVKFHYSEDFVNNYEMWNEQLKITNNSILEELFDIPKEFYKPILFDDMCKYIINDMEEIILYNGLITAKDAYTIIDKLYYDAIGNTIDLYYEEQNSVKSLINNFNKISYK